MGKLFEWNIFKEDIQMACVHIKQFLTSFVEFRLAPNEDPFHTQTHTQENGQN